MNPRGQLMGADSKIITNPDGQSHEEWLADYDASSGYRQRLNTTAVAVVKQPLRQSQEQTKSEQLTGEFVFATHRTNRLGRVALDFVHVETGIRATRFFNVELGRYRAGERGQFATRKGSLFRQFWLYAIGKPPRRWCRGHWEMHRLKAIKFIGVATFKSTESATSGYWSLAKIRKQSS